MRTILIATFMLSVTFHLNAKIIYIEPVRNANYVSVNNNIIIGFDEEILNSNLNSLITVKGNLSGMHAGEIIITSDKKKLIFKPNVPFAFNEQVIVKLNNIQTSSKFNNRLTYAFQTQINKLELDHNKDLLYESENSSDNNLVSSDYVVLPQLTVTVFNNPSPGHLYMTSIRNGAYTPHIIIANNPGTTHYFKELTMNAFDYKMQPNGLRTYFYSLTNKFYAEDSQNNRVDSFYCGNGYSTDIHELRVLNNGHALLMSYDQQTVNMSLIVPGGNPNATVVGLIIQEIDENKNVVFQWRSWDHFAITDAPYVNLLAALIDYVHGNAIELDNDGNLMISSRHLNEITKINRTTGDIIWRMGGIHNQFTFVNDTIPFRYQHCIRRIANGNIILFDNGNFRTPLFSRALEYQLDEVNKVATLVWQYRKTPDIYGQSMGSVQRLRNGNTLICWGQINPNFTEVTPAGVIALQMSLPQGVYSYRVFRDEVNLTINTKLIMEGFYDDQINKLNQKDTVREYLRSIVSPYSIVDSSISVVDSANFNVNFRFYNVTTGTYYISILHRNSIETWSKSGGEAYSSGGVYAYDFTSSDTQAYGNNLIQKGTKYCIYSGDVNQDGDIDAFDLTDIYNDLINFVSGYIATDTNGDRFVDIDDLMITYNNSVNSIGKITP